MKNIFKYICSYWNVTPNKCEFRSTLDKNLEQKYKHIQVKIKQCMILVDVHYTRLSDALNLLKLDILYLQQDHCKILQCLEQRLKCLLIINFTYGWKYTTDIGLELIMDNLSDIIKILRQYKDHQCTICL